MTKTYLQTSDRSRRNNARAVIGLGAVHYDLRFNIPNETLGIRRAPKTEIVLKYNMLISMTTQWAKNTQVH